MTLGTIVRGRLTTHEQTAPLLGERVYALHLPQNPTLPAATFQEVGTVPSAGTGTVDRVRLQVVTWSHDHDESDTLAAAVRAALDGHGDMSGSPKLIRLAFLNQRQGRDAETNHHKREIDFFAWIGD